jgi:hypothetical protein
VPDPRSLRIEALRAELAAAEAALAQAEAAAVPVAGEVAPEPEPEPAPTLFERHPSLAQYPEPRPPAHPGQPPGHGAGGHPGLGAAVGN